jgi:ORF6N domain-containing protein
MSASKLPANRTVASPERIERIVLLVRGQRVILDFDLAELYCVEARALNQAVKRNIERFPVDFMFRLSKEETMLVMRSQIVTSSSNSSQIVMSSKKHRGLAYRPFAFTEQGVAMLSSVLHSPRAVQVNIEIMRTFVRLRQWLASNAELAKRLDALEKNYDRKFQVVFEAIRQLMADSKPGGSASRREIGFHTIRGTPGKSAAKSTFVAP